MSQKDDANAIMKDMHAQLVAMTPIQGVIQSYISKLDTLLAASQNSPPDGKADGTISPLMWSSLSATCESYKRFIASLSNLKQ